MKQLMKLMCTILLLFIYTNTTTAGQLALIIDDFGYREHNEKTIIALPYPITVAVLPNSPNATNIAMLAHESGKPVIIHLPMAPVSRQPLELDTLMPTMNQNDIDLIINNAIKKVPYAIGMNNHMGSLMTSDLQGMRKVMFSLSRYSFFFLDSKTSPRSKVSIAAKEYRIATTSRDIFLDDSQDEKTIAHQLDLAIKFAQKNGRAIAIGHPHGTTVKVLIEKLANLPDDIELVPVSLLVKQPEKILLSELMESYQKEFEQSLLEYMVIKSSQ